MPKCLKATIKKSKSDFFFDTYKENPLSDKEYKAKDGKIFKSFFHCLLYNLYMDGTIKRSNRFKALDGNPIVWECKIPSKELRKIIKDMTPKNVCSVFKVAAFRKHYKILVVLDNGNLVPSDMEFIGVKLNE